MKIDLRQYFMFWKKCNLLMNGVISDDFQRDYFNKKDNRYDSRLIFNPPVHTKLETDYLISKIPRKLKYKLVVDFGAGNGRLTLPLVKKGFKVIAVDNSKKSLHDLKLNAKKFGLKVNTQSTIRNIKNIEIVTGCDVLHHVELENTLPKLFNTLKKDGMVIFSEPGAMNISWYIYISMFLDWRVERKFFQCTYFNLLRQFKNAGFKYTEISGLGLFPRAFFKNKKLCRFNDWLGNIWGLKLFAYRYLIRAYKN